MFVELARTAAVHSFVLHQDGAWNFLKWNKTNSGINHSASDASKAEFGFCHRILIYNKTSGYSTSATKRALADACAAVPHLLQVASSHVHFCS